MACGGVELGREFPVGGPGRGEVLIAFGELEAQVDGLLLEVGGPLLADCVDVGGRAEAGLAPGLLTECIGQALFKLPDAGVSRTERSWAASRSASARRR